MISISICAGTPLTETMLISPDRSRMWHAQIILCTASTWISWSYFIFLFKIKYLQIKREALQYQFQEGLFCIEVMGLQTDRLPKQSRRHFEHPRMHSHQSGASVLGEVIKDSTKFQVSAEIHNVHCQCLAWIDTKLLNVAPIFIKCVFPNACAHTWKSLLTFPHAMRLGRRTQCCHQTSGR